MVVLCLLAGFAPWPVAAQTDGVLIDPLDDTLGIGEIQLDVREFSGQADQENLWLNLTFESADLDAADLAGLIELDTDADPTSGALSTISFLCPNLTGLGVDYTIDLFNRSTGFAPIRDSAGHIVGQAGVRFEADELEIQVPLVVLEGNGTGIHAAAVIGTLSEASDCVPNGGFLVTSRGDAPPAFEAHPVPGLSLAWLVFLVIALAIFARGHLRVGVAGHSGRR